METIQRPMAEVVAEVRELKDKLIKTLENYCRSQVELWRQVPALAREADRLKGHTSGFYQLAYLCDYWPISEDIHGLAIKLQTGELGRKQSFRGGIELDNLDSILLKLDANEVINSLKSEIESLTSNR